MVADDARDRAGEVARRRYRIRGVVQGVGFRPFVHTLAGRLGLIGWVCNDAAGVVIEAQGPADRLEAFGRGLVEEAPPLAAIVALEAEPLAPEADPAAGFAIRESRGEAPPTTPVPPDVATCDACLAELADPADRRFGYPFLNCTDCGPRFSILRELPYDRPRTTMAGFPLCDDCRAEYLDPAGRRFHAQPIACPACGPTLWFVPGDGADRARALARPDDPDGWPRDGEAIGLARRAIAAGRVVAIKGVGGFHLACDATSEAAVARLRLRKGRPEKPFALMVGSLDEARRLAEVDEQEARALVDRARPIVLLRRRADPGVTVAEAVAPGHGWLGVMLPYSPLHPLLLEDGRPLVLTSGNRSDEPIVVDNAEALDRLGPVADAFLMHDRPIQAACDDSVLRVVDGRPLPLRRSRGFAPLPVAWPGPADGPPILAVGGELKATFCLAAGPFAHLSQHLGDWGDLLTLRAFERAVDHFCRLYRAEPAAVACDLHPDYLSAAWAARLAESRGLPLVRVQHHHAHVASLMLEHGLDGSRPILAWACDGTGYGPDGTIWGGELLRVDASGSRRLAHLAPVPLPGGDAAARHPARSALAHLWAAGIAWDADLPCVRATPPADLRVLARQIEAGLNCVATSSTGRLLDAAAALIGLRASASFEGQAAMELESLALRAAGDHPPPSGPPPCSLERSAPPGGEGGPTRLDPAPLWRRLVGRLRAGDPPARLALGVHLALADALATLAADEARRQAIATVGLTGGVFQNGLLAAGVVARLRAEGLEVLTHRLLPPNDGGLAAGQALVAAQQHCRRIEIAPAAGF